jgi:hypothetical protein
MTKDGQIKRIGKESGERRDGNKGTKRIRRSSGSRGDVCMYVCMYVCIRGGP